MPDHARARPGRRRALAAGVVLVIAIGAIAYVQHSRRGPTPGAAVGRVVPELAAGAGPARRTTAPYQGLGAWVDGFDFGVAYQRGGAAPPITPDVVDDLAA